MDDFIPIRLLQRCSSPVFHKQKQPPVGTFHAPKARWIPTAVTCVAHGPRAERRISFVAIASIRVDCSCAGAIFAKDLG
jgi:hypothetical protein